MDEVKRRIGIPPFKVTGETPRAYFEVGTSARQRGDDEYVVWELSEIFDAPGDPLDWKILWEQCLY
jgi:hypothetical protein